ncbi:MAG: DUF4298 domain-containing protein [Prevotella sp.]|nr:DUF4298 domain-containing protein [Prevotella sp.]
MEQIERIKQMELHLDRASSAVMQLSAALDNYIDVQESISVLDEYYSNDDWKQDYADDEAGLLPPNLRRGVLSEDAVWNLLSDTKEMNIRLLETVAEILKKK